MYRGTQTQYFTGCRHSSLDTTNILYDNIMLIMPTFPHTHSDRLPRGLNILYVSINRHLTASVYVYTLLKIGTCYSIIIIASWILLYTPTPSDVSLPHCTAVGHYIFITSVMPQISTGRQKRRVPLSCYKYMQTDVRFKF